MRNLPSPSPFFVSYRYSLVQRVWRTVNFAPYIHGRNKLLYRPAKSPNSVPKLCTFVPQCLRKIVHNQRWIKYHLQYHNFFLYSSEIEETIANSDTCEYNFIVIIVRYVITNMSRRVTRGKQTFTTQFTDLMKINLFTKTTRKLNNF